MSRTVRPCRRATVGSSDPSSHPHCFPHAAPHAHHFDVQDSDQTPSRFRLYCLPSCVLHALLTQHGLRGADLQALAESGVAPVRDISAAARALALSHWWRNAAITIALSQTPAFANLDIRRSRIPSTRLHPACKRTAYMAALEDDDLTNDVWPDVLAFLDQLTRFVATAPSRLAAAGLNSAGQTGVGPAATAPILTVTEVPGLPSVVHAAAGAAHSLAVSVDGALYAAGANFNDGRLGLLGGTLRHGPGLVSPIGTPRLVLPPVTGEDTPSPSSSPWPTAPHFLTPSPPPATSPWNAQPHHSITPNTSPPPTYQQQLSPTVPTNFAVLVAPEQGPPGNGSVSQTPPRSRMYLPFTRVPLGNHFAAQCAAGHKHSVVLTATGTVLVAGDNSRGQLGFPDRCDRGAFVEPTLPRNAARIVQVAAGAAHTVLLSENGRVYACGENRHAQLGLGRSVGSCIARFVEVPAPALACYVAAGEEHTLLVAANRTAVYGAGLNCTGQLGSGDRRDRASFERMDCPLRRVRCGRPRPGYNPACVSKTGNQTTSLNCATSCSFPQRVLHGLGRTSAESSTCNPSDRMKKESVGPDMEPHDCDYELIASASAGGSHSLLVTSWGRLLAAGEFYFGDGGCRTRDTFSELYDGVSSAAAGWSHSIAMSFDVQPCLRVAGENRYGSLGTGDFNARPQFVDVPLSSPPLSVAAGGAHSLVLLAEDDAA